MSILETGWTAYGIISVIVAIGTAIMANDDEQPSGIENIWDWAVYSILWPVQLVKALLKFFINLFK